MSIMLDWLFQRNKFVTGNSYHTEKAHQQGFNIRFCEPLFSVSKTLNFSTEHFWISLGHNRRLKSHHQSLDSAQKYKFSQQYSLKFWANFIHPNVFDTYNTIPLSRLAQLAKLLTCIQKVASLNLGQGSDCSFSGYSPLSPCKCRTLP